MQLPRIHLNGTPASRLMDQYLGAGSAVDAAIEALRAVDVNGRDYYPISPSATNEAVAEHCARIKALETIRSEIYRICEHIDDQGMKASPAA